MRDGGCVHQLDHAFGIGAVGDRDVQLYAALAVRKRPVNQAFGDQLAVRHDNFRAVVRTHDTRAYADAVDGARDIVHLDHVADLHRALEEQDQARHEIVENVLQPEAHADGKRAGKYRELSHVES